jgi:hypothetical protein
MEVVNVLVNVLHASMNLPIMSADFIQAVAMPTHDAMIESGSPIPGNQLTAPVFLI